MDNATYDVLNQSPSNNNETYSTLEIIPTNNHEAQKKDANKQDYPKGVPNNNKPLIVVITVMMVILLLITIASLALSVAAYNQSKSEQTTVQTQQSKADNSTNTTHCNLQ